MGCFTASQLFTRCSTTPRNSTRTSAGAWTWTSTYVRATTTGAGPTLRRNAASHKWRGLRADARADAYATPDSNASTDSFTLVADDSSVKTAVALWLSDRDAAIRSYGQIWTWDTSGVTDMSYLFCGSQYWSSSGCNEAAASFNDPIGEWDTPGVTSMYRMFYEASAFDQDLSWSLGNVTNMISMFKGASVFDPWDLGWCVADDADLDYAFEGTQCASTSCGVAWASAVRCGGSGGAIDDGTFKTAVGRWLSNPAAAEATYGHISTWNTSGVTSMGYSFSGKSSFDEDISAWDTRASQTWTRCSAVQGPSTDQ